MTEQPKRRVFPRIRYRLDREGKWWLLLAIVFWGIGMVKGMNLVALLGSLMLVIWVVNAVAAGRRLRGLRWRHWIERPVFAQAPVTVEVEIDSLRGVNPEGVRLEDRGPDHCLNWPVPATRDRPPIRLRQTITLPRRGRYCWNPLQAVSSFPFGLVEGSVTAGEAETLVVLPQLGHLHRGRLRRFLLRANAPEESTRRRSARHPAVQGEMFGVRAFRHGDSPKWIHWRTSARRGELMVREFEATPSENLIVLLDAWVPESKAPESAPPGQESLEAAISLVATVCWEWCRQHGDRFVLGILGKSPEIVEGITGHALARALLEALALEPGHSGMEPAALLDRLAAHRLPPGPVLCVSTRPGNWGDPWAGWLHRPVAYVQVSAETEIDFYERPTPHAP